MKRPPRAPWGSTAPSVAYSGKLPEAQFRCLEALGKVLTADPIYGSVRWSRNHLLTTLVWKGLAATTRDAIATGTWGDDRAKALRTWLGEVAAEGEE